MSSKKEARPEFKQYTTKLFDRNNVLLNIADPKFDDISNIIAERINAEELQDFIHIEKMKNKLPQFEYKPGKDFIDDIFENGDKFAKNLDDFKRLRNE